MHAVREEKLSAQQTKERNSLEKSHQKLVKKASKQGSTTTVQMDNDAKLSTLLQEHEEQVRPKIKYLMFAFKHPG